MNRINKLLFGILAFVVTCIVGYALFSETITVTGTATTGGNFDITATCYKGIYDKSGLTSADLGFGPEGGYANDSCKFENNKVTMYTDLLYPSATRHFTIKFTNTGSITAENPQADPDEPYLDSWFYHNTTQKVCEVNENNEKVNCDTIFRYNTDNGGSASGSFVNDASDIVGFEDKNGVFYNTSNADPYEFFNVDKEVLQLEPGESVYFAFSIYWPKAYTNSTNSAHYSLELTTEVPFEQVQ